VIRKGTVAAATLLERAVAAIGERAVAAIGE
jgi:hypothetical protein